MIWQIKWLAMQSISGMVYFFPATATVVVVSLTAIILNRPSRNEKYRYLPLALFLFPLIYLLYGFVFASKWSDAPTWAGYDIFLLLFIQLVVSIGVIVRMKGLRLYAFGISLLAAYVGLSFAFIAGMSVTGDWL